MVVAGPHLMEDDMAMVSYAKGGMEELPRSIQRVRDGMCNISVSFLLMWQFSLDVRYIHQYFQYVEGDCLDSLP